MSCAIKAALVAGWSYFLNFETSPHKNESTVKKTDIIFVIAEISVSEISQLYRLIIDVKYLKPLFLVMLMIVA